MQTLITQFKSLFGISRVLATDALANRYYHIWRMDEPLNAVAMLFPETTEEVSTIMRLCHEYDQPVAVFGGLTNLVGGTEVSADEVIISLERMNKVVEVDTSSRTITVQAGVTVEVIQQEAKSADLLFPLNFGAKGSAQIGGAISTNAGGLRVLRYGMTRQLVMGLEVVLADGTVISNLKKITKDNSGYDLKQWFVGAEGTLGIVTKAVMKLVEAPKSRNSVYFGINDYSNVVRLLRFMDAGCAGTLSGFELIWRDTFAAMTGDFASVNAPIALDYNYYVILETLGSDPMRDKESMILLLEQAGDLGLYEDAIIADTQADHDWFWRIREDVHVLKSQTKYDQHFDISLPIPLIGDVIDQITKQLKDLDGVEQVYTFGHVADGNIHYIIGKADDSEDLKLAINEIVYAPLQAIGGSVSAEHGIGLHKKAYLPVCRSEAEINLMRQMKQMLDSKGILNRGKLV